jgi:hypothetical protein
MRVVQKKNIDVAAIKYGRSKAMTRFVGVTRQQVSKEMFSRGVSFPILMRPLLLQP